MGKGLVVLKSWEQVWAWITPQSKRKRLNCRLCFVPLPAYFLLYTWLKLDSFVQNCSSKRSVSCWLLFKLIHKGFIWFWRKVQMSINTFVYQGIFSLFPKKLKTVKNKKCSTFYQIKTWVCHADLNFIFHSLYVLLTSSVSVYFSAAVNRSVVWLSVKGEVSQALTDILLLSGKSHPVPFVLAGYQSRRTLMHHSSLYILYSQ